jgi:hypothetical protein
VERALDLALLFEALGDRPPSEPAGIPTASQLQRLMSDLEVRLFTRQPTMPEELLRTAWYLHAVASSNEALGVFTPIRRQRAFQVSAHAFDLALQQRGWSRPHRLKMAFAAEIGYRRGGLDPNASAVYRMRAWSRRRSTSESRPLRWKPAPDFLPSNPACKPPTADGVPRYLASRKPFVWTVFRGRCSAAPKLLSKVVITCCSSSEPGHVRNSTQRGPRLRGWSPVSQA